MCFNLSTVANYRNISSIKAELIPRIVRKQFSKVSKKQEAEDEDDGGRAEGENRDGGDIHSFIPKDLMTELAQRLSFWNDHNGDLKDAYHGRPLRDVME